MNNLILIGLNETKIESYISNFLKREKIEASNVYKVKPSEGRLGAEQIREIIKLAGNSFSTKSVFIIYNFETAKEVIQNSFLKTLEEHQENIYFLMISHSSTGILPTILSRSQLFFLSNTDAVLTPADIKLIETTINELKANSTLLTSIIKTSPTKKKEQITDFLTKFCIYVHQQILANNADKWLIKKAKKAIEAKHLITENNIDPELAADNVFLE
jgi:DNA polymerase III delta prime subunit